MESIDASQILHAVEVMVKRYGESAGEQAAIRAKELSDSGDSEGAQVWQEVALELKTRLAEKHPSSANPVGT